MPEVLFRNELGVKQPTEVPKHAHALFYYDEGRFNVLMQFEICSLHRKGSCRDHVLFCLGSWGTQG